MTNKWIVLLLSLALAGAAVGCSDDKKKDHGGHDADVTDDGGANDGDVDSDGGNVTTSELIVASEGGEISLDDATLTIPADALDDDTTITVEQLSAAGLPGADNVIGSVYDFGPDGTTFNTPVTLVLNGSNIPAGAVIAFLNANDEWEALGDSVVGDGHVTATTTHFTKFAIVITPTTISGSCPSTFTACGGDLVGDWTLIDSEEDCVTAAQFGAILNQFQCSDKSFALEASFTGTAVFGESNYSLGFEISITQALTLGKDCTGGQCVEGYEENQDGKCVGSNILNPDSPNSAGTYTVDNNNVITFTKQGQEPNNEDVTDYCITGSGANRVLTVRSRGYTDETHTTLDHEFWFHAKPSNKK